MNNNVINILIFIKMQWIKFTLWLPLLSAFNHPMNHQKKLLKRIIKNQKNTKFGKDHKFNQIHDYSGFKNNVSIQTYESLRPYIEMQESQKTSALNEDHPILYAQTSGSTGSPKLIPILKHSVAAYKRSQKLVSYAIYKDNPQAFSGKILAIVSPAVEGYLLSGAPFGSMSGLIYQSMPLFTRLKYVLPAAIFDISDYEKKYTQIAIHAMLESNISMIATANPSTLIKMVQLIKSKPYFFIDQVSKLSVDRGEALKSIFSSKGQLAFEDLWPNLKAIVTWTCGSCSLLLGQLKKLLPKNCHIIEMGYLSSEFRGSLTVDVINNKQVLTFYENFYEFVDKDDWENNNPTFKSLNQLTVGKYYYIFITTASGLYRYNINDIIQVTGYIRSLPTIQFIQKGKGVVNLTGEKLYESHLVQAVKMFIGLSDSDLAFFIMLGCPHSLTYTLYLECKPLDASRLIELISQQNIEFEAKLKSGRLSINIIFLKSGAGEDYKQFCIKKGQRENQFKFSYLQIKEHCIFDFTPYKVEA